MPQNQCVWCGRLGGRYEEGTPRHEQPGPHDDGSACVCRHVSCSSRQEALIHGGRYFDEQENRWVCPSCGTAPPPTDEELYDIDSKQDEEF